MPEVIPELVYVVGLFFAIVGYLTARGLLATWTHSLGYVFAWLAAKLPDINTHIPGVPHINLKAPFQAIDSWVVTALQNWCDGAEIEVGYCLHGMANVARYTAQMVDWLAAETEHSFDALVHIRLPKWAKWVALAAIPPALLAKLIQQAVAHAVPKIVKTTQVVTHDVTHTVTTIVRKTAGGAVALPGWVIHLPRRLKGIDEIDNNLAKRLRKVEGVFGATVAAAIIANALGIATKCLRNGNVGKAARNICGFDSNLIESLLADGLAIVGVLSVVEFVKELQAIEGEALKIIGAGIREWPS